MTNRITARTLSEIVKPNLQRSDPEPGLIQVNQPFVVEAIFIPPGIPLSHPIREFHDDRAYSDNAPGGFWDLNIWDIDEDTFPAGRAAFVKTRGIVICDRLSVERAYRGLGLGHRLIGMGQRLWGGLVRGASKFNDEHEEFWCSEPSSPTTWLQPAS